MVGGEERRKFEKIGLEQIGVEEVLRMVKVMAMLLCSLGHLQLLHYPYLFAFFSCVLGGCIIFNWIFSLSKFLVNSV